MKAPKVNGDGSLEKLGLTQLGVLTNQIMLEGKSIISNIMMGDLHGMIYLIMLDEEVLF